jgi:hypothetical protein
MTANELADWIENGSPFGDYETAKQASAMLREQQAVIESLKDKILSYENLGSMMINELMQKASEK